MSRCACERVGELWRTSIVTPIMFLHDNLISVQSKIAAAAERAGRKAADVELVAVTKTFPVEDIREAMEAGQRLVGENRVQELLTKQPNLPSSLRWHLIGHLQSNKVRKVLP